MSITLNPNREKSLLRRHPWIFASAIRHVDETHASGSTVDLLSSEGQFLARASYSPNSQIRARVWTFNDEPVDEEFFRKRIRAAIEMRSVLSGSSKSLRLIHAESDGLPGLIVDRYEDVLVLQSLTAGSEFWKETIADLLVEETGIATIYERSDADVRELEGLKPITGILRGTITNLQLPITEYGLEFKVDIAHGHKTGFYLDQRENRRRVGELSKNRDVLNCFCYTGGFSIHALANGAKSVLSVDSSADALALLEENIALNQLPADRHTSLEGDVFQLLRKFRDANRSFDLIVLDPPKFAPTAAHAEKASRAYKDINLLAFKLLRRGGLLFTYSCSGGIDAALFQKIVASAALDAGVDATIIEHLSQGSDHPVSLHFPEGMYLKGLVCVKG
ncbi:MAG TPA: class I SAM-dependent rRNA methyltransferase [Anaerolineales bacterium]|nr:class I SAM-dependent rRNA methyltransferase [Anaerolineales bacterium]HNB88740.1 class I SAM-dependent rRNA methyltransferase [Anaerolineales bacterium]HNC91030.1 class I SAM-dependent rRNA methyltransferase [Anaerolineales bacterium]HNE70173.1 class I SAM-dependent rRNA methyltransferase [Anaerolineales bacterium]HNF36678.1 class I SAM-dependent rRNA methyltransferase [Anaerolineales bacterium]